MAKRGRLNIFIDETGDPGFKSGRDSELYGVSLIFHAHKDSLEDPLKRYNAKMKDIGYNGMIHMADLVCKRGDYENMPLPKRRKIYNALFHLYRQAPVRQYSFTIDKAYINTRGQLKQKLRNEIENLFQRNQDYFRKFNEVVLYYDKGQKILQSVIEETFYVIGQYEWRDDFDHTDKKLFQIADMLTFLSKLFAHHKNGQKMSKSERAFFDVDMVQLIRRSLEEKRL